MILRADSDHPTQCEKTQWSWFLFIVLPILFFLGYLYWWLMQPSEKRLASIEMETPSPTKAPSATKRNDLTKIKGIGPITSQALYAQGIRLYYQIALMSEDELRGSLSKAGIRLANLSTWPQQARLAALEKWEELEELQKSI
ncbi:MAG: 50S ribosomal protein L21 [Chloroflexi bacterium]|nr:50S ribosomal protein L21 [Chloroflexota bacterium]